MRKLIILALCIGVAGCGTGSLESTDETLPSDAKQLSVKLLHADSNVRFQARMMLMKQGDVAVPHLVHLLQGTDAMGRFEAAAALCGMNAHTRSLAVPTLIKAVKSGDAKLRDIAIQALRSIGPAAREAIPALEKVVRDQQQPHCSRAVFAVARIQGAEALPVLVSALQSEETCVPALQALGDLGPLAKDALQAVSPFVEHNDVIVRDAAVIAIRNISKGL